MCEQPEVKGHGIQNSSLVGAADMGLQNAHSRLLIYALFKVCFHRHSCCFFIGRFKHDVQSSVWQVQNMFIL